MRAFFALDIDPRSRDAIARWRTLALPRIGRAVRTENFHITLSFLGNLQAAQVDALCARAARLETQAFELLLDTPGCFPKSGIFWIGASDPPPALGALVKALRGISRKAGLNTERRPYHPHLTLLRKCLVRPPAPLIHPEFLIACPGFTLYESITGHAGARYHRLRHWPGVAAKGS